MAAGIQGRTRRALEAKPTKSRRGALALALRERAMLKQAELSIERCVFPTEAVDLIEPGRYQVVLMLSHKRRKRLGVKLASRNSQA
jgi:hypothetical protein